MNKETNEASPIGQYRPNLSMYHANGKGTGCAVKMSLHPAHDNVDGCIMVTMANQMTVGNRNGPNVTFPTFDWDNAICVKLGFTDLSKMLQVFRGECESLEDGKGLLHRSPKGLTNIKFHHMIEPISGYSLEVYRTHNATDKEDAHARIIFNAAEAGGICEAIAGSMYVIGFGIPMLVPHSTAAYKAEVGRMCNEHAA